MKIHNLLCGLSFCLILVSCEKSFEIKMGNTPDPGTGSGNTGGNAASGTLIKFESTGSKGTTTNDYEYDAAGNLSRVKMTNVIADGGTQVKRYVRDNTGRVVKIVSNVKAGGITGGSTLGGTDSTIVTVHYPSASSAEFDYAISSLTMMGMTIVDSTAYKYTNGKITEADTYITMGGLMSILSSQMTYTYDANGNVITSKYFIPDASGTGTAMDLAVTYTTTFDDKVAALQLGNLALLGGGWGEAVGKNNATKVVIDASNLYSSVQNQTTSINYQYNAAGKPATADYTNPIVGNLAAKYYYKP